ncbi:MAG TPA: aminopeptidase P family protein [Clostridiaceae bacterium]|nr:aminopeptidase P family protein [Clostridiaceae bacterium]
MKYLDFPLDEMEQRVINAQRLLAKEGMSGMVVTAAANHFYFSGIRKLANWATFTRTVFVFLPTDKKPVLYVQEFDGPEAESRSSIRDVRTYPDIMGGPVHGVVEILRELGMDRGKVGWELGYEQRLDMAVSDYNAVKDLVPNAEFIDASELIWQLRMIKLPSEIACLRKANDIASRAFDRVFGEISEGMTEKEVARKFVAIMAEEGAELPGFIIVLSGPGNYDRIAARPTNKRIEKGDLVWIDAGVNYDGYWTDFCRAGVVGGATAEQNRLQNIIVDITRTACDEVKPGLPVSDLYNICAEQFLAYGLPWSFECGRAGHGVGLQLTEPPSIARVDSTILEPGMVITLEPGYVNEFGCFDCEENILVTETGSEILTSARRELHYIPLA